MIYLKDLIELSGIILGDYKIHCATGKNPTPLEAFFDGNFKVWQEEQNQKNFECEQILSLINLDKRSWLFAGLWKNLGYYEGVKNDKQKFYYITEEVNGLEHLVGRTVVEFVKYFRASYLRGPKYINELIVTEIKPRKMSLGDFPGYDSILLSHRMLRLVIREEIPTWKSALSSIGGVYIIVDTSNGRHYIGSASGTGGIWQRWSNYSQNGHGGNKELQEVLQLHGEGHLTYFQYSILEIFDASANMEYTIEREYYWKRVLLSRQFGYNRN